MLAASVSDSIDNATPISVYEETSTLVITFDCICEAFSESQRRPATYRQEIMALEAKLRTGLNELHIS